MRLRFGWGIFFNLLNMFRTVLHDSLILICVWERMRPCVSILSVPLCMFVWLYIRKMKLNATWRLSYDVHTSCSWHLQLQCRIQLSTLRQHFQQLRATLKHFENRSKQEIYADDNLFDGLRVNIVYDNRSRVLTTIQTFWKVYSAVDKILHIRRYSAAVSRLNGAQC